MSKKNILLLITVILVFFSSSLLAIEKASQKMPFIGKREFNFSHEGALNEEYLLIKKNGQYRVGHCSSVDGKCIDSHKGKYTNPFPSGKGVKYLIHNNKIYVLNKNGEIEIDCANDNGPCESELYKVPW